ncbi:TNF receptor-associated factor 2 isoform X1 [Acipenser oxyrinchus oxyrinchus]|uniref:TNF receptor-associated factor n=1 Tax=Acipenser oxyrinchus oxyrinchus TaxID=40147 RepID=A0AAD8FTU8_ACIOX|nr:TNF receptor-associated factor 2 isoform X1 [Acipenser oxyrinchus oxyrinchus]
MAKNSLESSLPGFILTILGTSLEPKYLCRECCRILRKPVQAQCGHRFCWFCYNNITSSGPQRCTACQQEGIFEEPASILDTNSAFPDNAARREIENLPAVCNNEVCSWKGSIKEYETSHEGKCERSLVQCQACQEMIQLSEKEQHSERECPERNLNCRYCKLSFSFKHIKAHDEICQKFPLQCEGCGKKKILREKFADHARSCSKYKSPCRFSAVGCNVIVENEKMLHHEQGSMAEHLRMLLAAVQSLREREGQPRSLQAPHSKAQELGSSIRELEQRLGSLGLYCSAEEEEEEEGGAAATLLSLADRQLNGYSGKAQALPKLCEALARKLSTFENIVCVLNREVEKSSLTLEAYSQQHRLDQQSMDSLTHKVRQMERSLAMKDLAIAELEQKFKEQEFSTYDGIFIWKIGDFTRKRQDAREGRTPAMFSPGFYTSKYGYKMCMRLYLNGDGTGRGTHLSLFFVVMKGNSDALLKWPFNQKVTLMLLDQNNREHIIDAFRPDVTSSSFQRPISEMNIASGCPLFCPLAKLEGKSSYLRDDTIFIKAIVDLTGL